MGEKNVCSVAVVHEICETFQPQILGYTVLSYVTGTMHLVSWLNKVSPSMVSSIGAPLYFLIVVYYLKNPDCWICEPAWSPSPLDDLCLCHDRHELHGDDRIRQQVSNLFVNRSVIYSVNYEVYHRCRPVIISLLHCLVHWIFGSLHRLTNSNAISCSHAELLCVCLQVMFRAWKMVCSEFVF